MIKVRNLLSVTISKMLKDLKVVPSFVPWASGPFVPLLQLLFWLSAAPPAFKAETAFPEVSTPHHPSSELSESAVNISSHCSCTGARERVNIPERDSKLTPVQWGCDCEGTQCCECSIKAHLREARVRERGRERPSLSRKPTHLENPPPTVLPQCK